MLPVAGVLEECVDLKHIWRVLWEAKSKVLDKTTKKIFIY